jgi:hypothetical protein
MNCYRLRFSLILIFMTWFSAQALAQVGPESIPLLLEKAAIQFFLDHTNKETGLVRDRAKNFIPTPENNRMASLAATGMGFAVLANAAQRGLIDTGIAHEQILRALRFTEEKLYQREGWFYHFVDWQTGERFDRSEVSTIDTAWFFAGGLYAAMIFPGGEIEERVNRLFLNVNFADMMTDGGRLPNKKTLSMGWTPENGYLPYQWDTYAEQILLLFLGLGHPQRPVALEAWEEWRRKNISHDLPILGSHLPLFIHQYSHLFIDFRNFNDEGTNYFTNSVNATLADRGFCRADGSFETYEDGFWGLSAGDSPDGYMAFSRFFHNGTVCVGCVAGSAMFTSDIILSDLAGWMNGPWGLKIFGIYGPVDSLNLDRNWIDEDVIGITVGTMYLSLTNINEETSIWKDFSKSPVIQRAFKRLQKKSRR